MKRRTEGGGDHAGRSGERNAVATAGYRIHGEALLLKPGLHSGDIGIRNAELRGELDGRKPLVEERRSGILLRGEKAVESALLRCRAAEDERDALQLH